MRIIVIFILIVFLMYSCMEQGTYLYKVEIEKCNGKIDTVYYKGSSDIDLYIRNHNVAVPILTCRGGNDLYLNVCRFKIIERKRINEDK